LKSDSKVVVKRTKFWTFFALPNLNGAATPKSCTCLITPVSQYVTWQSLIKLRPFGSKVLTATTLHFKPIFHQPLKKIVKSAPVPDEGCASKT